MKRRLKESPFYVTDEPIIVKEGSEVLPHSYHIMSNKAKVHAPKARRYVLSTIKKYPGIVSETERQPIKQVLITSVPPKKEDVYGAYVPSLETYFVRGVSDEMLKKDRTESEKQKLKQKNLAAGIFHESKHREQDLSGKMNYDFSTQEELKEIEETKESPDEKLETEAYEYMEKKIEEYPYGKKPKQLTGKQISKILELD
jgi:hypothetical protein